MDSQSKLFNKNVTRMHITTTFRIVISVIFSSIFLLWALYSHATGATSVGAANSSSADEMLFRSGQGTSQTTTPWGLTDNRKLDVPDSGTYTVAMATDAVGLDPSLLTYSDSFLVPSQIYETLVNYETGGTIPTPGLADSWTVSTDGLTWTFNLHPGIKFQDGTDLDAAAVLSNFQRWWDPANPYHTGTFQYFAAYFGGFKGDSGCIITDIKSPSTSQLQISLKQPNNAIPSMLALPAFGIASPNAIQAGTLATIPVGSGPFKFTARVPGTSISLEAIRAIGEPSRVSIA
jgi:ABC-type transport system substrate-binding protein